MHSVTHFKLLRPTEDKKTTKLEVLPYIVRLQNVPSFSNVNSFCWLLVWSWPYALNITCSKLPLQCSRESSVASPISSLVSHISLVTIDLLIWGIIKVCQKTD